MPKTTIQLCGRFVVLLDGQRIEKLLPGRLGRLLFGYLALNRDRPVGRDELIEALWFGDLPREPADNLAALISRTRAAIGERHLTGRGEVTLRLPADADVDVEQAVAAVHRAESACVQEDWSRAWASSTTAQLISQRVLLSEHEAEWLDSWRSKMGEVQVRALDCYVRACLGLGGTERAAAVRGARLLVGISPLRESGYELLMAALEAQGNVAEALVAYEDARRLLRDELGVQPAESLDARYRQLLRAAPEA